ncbi:type III polyketide synthase [Desertivirga brevis]|uniref:type III polyketide synthase n=1 Tax=Desertivirga brevis TaxID=2810310 RepID=UPI001A96733F|nr:type III polyketide synthase [Pedobacter sp. SYSU D00873]
MGSTITAIGTANPQYRFPQMKILEFMTTAHNLDEQNSSRLRKLYEASGIHFRHSVIPDFGVSRGTYTFFGNEPNLDPFPGTKERSNYYEKTAKDLAIKALDDLSNNLHFDLIDATHLITVSCTGMYAPGLDIDIVQELKLAESIERTCINFMGCYGAFNALKTADYICRANPDAKVLIVDVELCTLHFQRENTMENWVANSLFADGAAAVMVENVKTNKKGLALKTFYNLLVTDAKDEMAWRIGDYGYEMRLSSGIAKNIGKKINTVADDLSARAGISRTSINHTAVHPGGRRILEVCEEMLGLPEEALDISYETLRQNGNMSSVTILFILKRFLEETAKGENIMTFAFGPGLTVESMILQSI